MIQEIKFFAFTLDLEPEYSGQINYYEIFNNQTKIEEILSNLNSLGIKITVFVVGEILKLYPNIVKIFEKFNCEFEVHSYSHKTVNVNHEFEISEAKKAYFDYFKKNPIGYREPCGRASKKTISLLERYGFLYDSSIFPSYYPDPFKYLFCNRNIHYLNNSHLLEIPLTSITPFRITLSLSYLKLLGIDFYFLLLRFFKLPDFICFDAHLHDFIICENSFVKLPLFWKLIYSRNKFLGFDYCMQFLKYIKQLGYQFCYLSQVYNLYKDKFQRK